ncbi:E3 ubiquitin-protein ligase rnf8-A-like isoform X2 [Metopolophium dirhodum]|uniref:E3 ubiquitin-protein ligase rnf8-A-like isoform X2 n=1 Tax=Metopolophium dirhodum TaxID=44670 RepID=UPI00298FF091|nr:E3 ubiquitin-protein ligase rnf8-A-like isoform X2 [Metopolophium dirhodum]
MFSMYSSSVCLYYMRGSCRFGNHCWNSHDLGTVRTDMYNIYEDEEINFVVGARRETTPMTASPNRSVSGPRQKNQVLPDSANKSSETHEAASSASQDKWCLKNIDTEETRTGSPNSVLVETVKKLNEADNLVESLREQLRVKNEEDNFSWIEYQMEQCLKSDLQCNICYEMFIKPTVLNCSHTFCHECIESWTRRVNHCPTCRVYVKNKSYCLTLHNYLDKIVDCLPDEIKTRRETLKFERNNNRVEVSKSQRNNARRRNHRDQSIREALGVHIWGEHNRDGAEWNIAPEEQSFDVFGRNRDDWDDWDDEVPDDTLQS